MPTVTVYSRENCHLCDEVEETVAAVVADLDREVTVEVVDVDEDTDLRESHGDRVPYVLVDGTPKFKYRVDAADLRSVLTD